MARTHVVLGDEVIQAIDQLVGQRGRSRFLEEAAREKLDRLALDKALTSTAGVVQETDYPEFRDQSSINRWVRSCDGKRRTPAPELVTMKPEARRIACRTGPSVDTARPGGSTSATSGLTHRTVSRRSPEPAPTPAADRS